MFNVISIFQVQITNECGTREPILIRKTAFISLVQVNKQNFPIRVNRAYGLCLFAIYHQLSLSFILSWNINHLIHQYKLLRLYKLAIHHESYVIHIINWFKLHVTVMIFIQSNRLNAKFKQTIEVIIIFHWSVVAFYLIEDVNSIQSKCINKRQPS